MKTESVHILDNINIVRIESYGDKLSNVRVTILQDCYAEEGTYYPQQSITVWGPSLKALRELLNTLPLE